ncbi:GNAT family N-acetyltransferase [Amycolatopsis sp. NPDC059021]|uniref:GNAT family N-acetyltransferase n=1 Tax=Amycolatopsis sp. NPDC059021 TaxID=3346704 RepID=UPI00366A9771
METPAETLPDEDLVLARWRASRLGELAATAGESAGYIGVWLPWAMHGYGEREAAEFLKTTAGRWERGEAYEYAVMLAGTLVGGCGLMARERGMEIGYWLGEPYTGRGTMTRAAALLTAEALRIGAPYVEIKHDERNTRSAGVPARLGYRRVRTEVAAPPLPPACSGTNVVWRKDS